MLFLHVSRTLLRARDGALHASRDSPIVAPMPRLNLNQTFNMMHWPLEANKVTVHFLNASGSARLYDFAFYQSRLFRTRFGLSICSAFLKVLVFVLFL